MKDIPEDLLDACIRGDRKAQHEFYKLSYSFLSSICSRYMNNKEDADELLNMGFLKILNNLHKRRSEVPLVFWIRRVMINTLNDEFRRTKKEHELVVVTDFSGYYKQGEDSILNEYVKKTDADYIHRLVMELPEMSRKVFNLYVVDGFNHREVGELLGISEGTSKWHLNSARTALKKKLVTVTDSLTVVAS